MHQTLLVELFTEELPPKALKKLGDAFASSIANGLRDRGLVGGELVSAPPNANTSTGAAFEAKVFATPRRLAVSTSHVLSVAADQAFIEKLMPVAVGLDKDGKATPALLKKLAAKSLSHIDVATLERENDGKADQLIYRGRAAGQSLQQGLQAALDDAIKNLPVPKVMSYQLADGATTVQFVRPAHALVALHGANVVPVTALGLTAGRITHGHRFQGAADIELKHADEYESRMEKEGGVVASFDKRKAEIESQLRETAEQHGANLGPTDDYAALLDEVTALVERPTVYVGAFETEFLSVPAECLILTMKLNQKYFPLFDRAGKLSNQFLIVSNMRLDDPHNIIEGNQRVVRPRLSDARFFFETDKKTKLEARVPKLANVVYHNKLGSQLQRTERVEKLSGHIAKLIGVDVTLAMRAAYLAKADLLTDMVGEFPELQGTMGRYYAMHDEEPQAVADAIEQHYLPKGASGSLPQNSIGLVVALADKLETLVGMFGIGNLPTGDKDPFALRRNAMGVARLCERIRSLNIGALLKAATSVFDGTTIGDTDKLNDQLYDFILDRYKSHCSGSPGLLLEKHKETGHEVVNARPLSTSVANIEAVLSQRPQVFADVPGRIRAVNEFMRMDEAISLAAANKRIGNILKKSDAITSSAQEALFAEPAERSLFDAIKKTAPTFNELLSDQKYTAALQSLAPLKIPVDAFFENVMVNAEDLNLRNNRLALLNDLHVMMNKVADLSKLAA
jgi:glycyl-tRNA synthetase beta chain